MKLTKFISLWFAIALILTGCASKPYKIIESKEGKAVKLVYVKVEPTTSDMQMRSWSNEIETAEKVEGKIFMINFMKSDELNNQNDIMATYREGALHSATGRVTQ